MDIMRRLKFRILDSDIKRLKSTEAVLLKLIRRYDFDGDVCQVAEMLEHGRLGVADALPALEINNIVASKGKALTEESLRSIFEKLYALSVQQRKEKA